MLGPLSSYQSSQVASSVFLATLDFHSSPPTPGQVKKVLANIQLTLQDIYEIEYKKYHASLKGTSKFATA